MIRRTATSTAVYHGARYLRNAHGQSAATDNSSNTVSAISARLNWAPPRSLSPERTGAVRSAHTPNLRAPRPGRRRAYRSEAGGPDSAVPPVLLAAGSGPVSRVTAPSVRADAAMASAMASVTQRASGSCRRPGKGAYW